MYRICNALRPMKCRTKIMVGLISSLIALTMIFGGRIALSSISQPAHPRKWSEEQRKEFKKELTRDGLRLMTAQLIEARKASHPNPFAGWTQSRNDRSVQLEIGTGSEALRNAEHYLFARAFVSAWDERNARAFAGTALFFGQIAWSLGKTFDDYSVPTSAEFQSGFDGIIDGYDFPGRASESSTPTTGWYYWAASIASIVVMITAGLISMLFLAALICRLKSCWTSRCTCLG